MPVVCRYPLLNIKGLKSPTPKLEKPESPFPLGSLPAGFGNGEEILVMLST